MNAITCVGVRHRHTWSKVSVLQRSSEVPLGTIHKQHVFWIWK